MSKKFKLYKHNLDAYEAVKDTFESKQQIASIVQATGTGKTFVAINLAKEVYPKKMLFVAPTIAIIEHIKNVIAEYGLTNLVNIEFATYQSFINKSHEDIENIKFDYLVVDEFHHTGAPIWGQRITDLINYHEDAFVLGMSAYTVRDKGTRYAMDVAPSIIKKMTDESIDEDEELPIFADSVVHRYDLSDALLDGTLKEPKYIFSKIKLYGYAQVLTERLNSGNISAEEKAKYLKELDNIMANLIVSDEVQQLLKENIKPNSKCIYFVPIGRTDGVRNIENAKIELQKIFPDAVIYSTTSDDELGEASRRAFASDVDMSGRDVSNKLRIMVAINQYNEGVHAEGVDTVIMGRATQSDIVFYEQLGRALSVTNSAIPLCIDLSGNLDFILDLIDEIGDKKRLRYAETGNMPRQDKQIPTFTFGIDPQFIILSNRLQEIDSKTENWNLHFEELKQWLNLNNGNYPSAASKNDDEKRLGIWVMKQRQAYKNKQLSEDRIEKLKSIDFQFVPYLSWNESFEQLKEFLNKNNSKYPSKASKNDDEKRLGQWVINQRQSYKNKQLTEDRIEKLKSIVFQFVSYPSWDEYFDLLKEYLKKNNGKYPSSKSKNDDEKSLGIWVTNQRQAYKNNQLSEDRLDKLKSIDFQFVPYLSWNESFEQLKKFLNKNNGKYPSSTSNNDDEKRLGRWVTNQRQAYKNNQLSEDRLDKLKSINFKFSVISFLL